MSLLAEPQHRTSEKVREPMVDKVLTLSKLTAEDRAIYMRLVMSLRWREQIEKYHELNRLRDGESSYDLVCSFYEIRGLFFHYDQKRAKRIQKMRGAFLQRF
jgi:hypothetical protein